jgi:hypothetical protein
MSIASEPVARLITKPRDLRRWGYFFDVPVNNCISGWRYSVNAVDPLWERSSSTKFPKFNAMGQPITWNNYEMWRSAIHQPEDNEVCREVQRASHVMVA